MLSVFDREGNSTVLMGEDILSCPSKSKKRKSALQCTVLTITPNTKVPIEKHTSVGRGETSRDVRKINRENKI